MKLVGITAIGTYFSPWFPACLSSIYDACDTIVVANHGFLLDDLPNIGPLEKAHEWIRNLDADGKVIELTHIDPTRLRHSFPVGTQRAANLRRSQGGEGNWYDLRGLNLTAANEFAVGLGADWILKIDTDEVCYPGLSRLKEDIGTYAFHQLEFHGEIGLAECYLAEPPPASPYIDTVQTYRADPDTWYLGAGAIAGPPVDRKPTNLFRCAHLRGANPWYLSPEEKLRHFYGRTLWQLYTNDYGYFSDEMKKQAMERAETLVKFGKGFGPVAEPPVACRVEYLWP